MAEVSSVVVETASQLVKGEAIHVAFSRDTGGSYSIFVSSEKSVVRDLCVTAVTFYGIYTASKLMARAIDGAVNKWLGGPREDQNIFEIKPGSLHVKLHCFTDERFLEVWTDFESGRMKDRLEEEFTQIGIDVEGLKIKIENMEEVNDTMRAIEIRQKPQDLQKEEDMKSPRGDKVEEVVKDMNTKLIEIRENQERVEYNMKTSLENLKREIIDEIRAPQTTSQKSAKRSQSTRALAEVIVIGGNAVDADTTIASVEKHQLGLYDAAWVPLPSMNEPRSLAASVVIDETILVVGGSTHTIETLDVSRRPLQWMISEAVLPFGVFGHSCVVYNGKLIVIGGFNCSTGNYSNAIHEVHLAKPYSSELLCTLPKPICYHGAEMINDKIYIFGGKGKERTPYDDILVFDPVTNECRELSKLPYPLRYILTAQWENKVVLLGGERGDGAALKEVIMFDPMSKKCNELPAMNHARKGAVGVIAGDVIVVAGGRKNNKAVNSVECFDLRNKTWKDLPPMKEARAHATAVCV